MRCFLSHLSHLVRTGDTRILELVIGSLSLILGMQTAATVMDFLPENAFSEVISPWGLWLIAILFMIGGSFKIIGAVMNYPKMRAYSAISTSGVWAYLFITAIVLGSVFSTALYAILAAQSAWIYIRLSILRDRTSA